MTNILDTTGMNWIDKICYYMWIFLFCVLMLTQVVFLILRFVGVIDWGWIYIFVPFFGIVGLFLLLFICLFIDLAKYS